MSFAINLMLTCLSNGHVFVAAKVWVYRSTMQPVSKKVVPVVHEKNEEMGLKSKLTLRQGGGVKILASI